MHHHTNFNDCWDFNEQGYCKDCGLRRPEPPQESFHPLNGEWPRNTWFQQRRKLVALKELP